MVFGLRSALAMEFGVARIEGWGRLYRRDWRRAHARLVRTYFPLQFAVGKFENTLQAVLRGASDRSVDFGDLRHLLLQLGFEERIKGGHFTFSRHGMVEIINLQPVGSKAKAYQVKQVRNLIVKYQFAGEEP